MPPSLYHRVESVRRAATRLVWLYGLCRWAAVIAVMLLVAGLLDYLLRPHDPAARWLLSLVTAAVVALAFVKLTWPALAFRQKLVAVARRIEGRFPELGERLSSAMAFLSQSEHDPTAGSPALRRAVVAEAEAVAADLDFPAVLDRDPPRRAAIAALVAFAALGMLAALNPPAANLAMARLAQPWRDLPWPRRHELAFVDPPARLAAGDNFEVELVDRRGTLPGDVQIQLRYETPSGWRIENKPMQPLGKGMVFRLDNVAQSFAYRARGGDDDTMPWRELKLVEPPNVIELAIEVTPPEYAGQPTRSEDRVVRALVGSRLRIRGVLDQPIASAVPRGETEALPLPAAEVAADGRSFTAPARGTDWPVERSGAFWFELTDASGVAFGKDSRIELHAVADAPPSLAWEAPADRSFVTARALVQFQGLVKDDLAVKSVQLRYLRPGASEAEQVVDLYVGQASAVGQASRLPGNEATVAAGAAGETIPIDHGWDLSNLAGLAPGDVLAVRLTAEDFKPQLATSIVRRLTIITEEELESRIVQRQGAILNQLAEALRIARQAREQTGAIAIRLQETGRLGAGDLNHLQAAQHNQRQVLRLLAAAPDGAQGQIQALLDELAANRVTSEATAQRLSGLLAGVRALNEQPLAAIDQQLTEAFKAARAAADQTGGGASDGDCAGGAPEVAEQLRSVGSQQDEVIGTLEGLLGSLSEWDSFSRLAREIGQLREDEARLADETEALRLAALAATGEAPAANRATARQLAQRQRELARRLDKVQSRMEEMLTRLDGDELAAGTLADALGAARRLAIGGRMREAASRLADLELGAARETEQVVLDSLDELLAMLSMRRDYELARAAASLREAAAEVNELLKRSRAARAELSAAAADSDLANRERELQRLTKELEELADRASALGRRLQRLKAPRAAEALEQAAGSARAAARAAAAGEAENAGQQAREAEQRLEDAERAMAQAVAEAEEDLAREQMARALQQIAGLAARQKNVLAEIERIDGGREGQTPLETAQQSALRNVAAEQRLLADETDQLRPRLSAAEAFAFALEGAAREMRRAGGFLVQQETGSPAQDAARSALTRLEQILAALRPEEPSPTEAQPPDAPPDQPPMGPPPGNLAAALAELKLLKLLQEEVNRRTVELAARRAPGSASDPEVERELVALAQEQGRLADMVLNLIQKTAPPEEP